MPSPQPNSATVHSGRAHAAPHKETLIEQAASFIAFFIYLLVLKSFFLPLFIIPTGSMAETLYGAHAIHTCPNCGTEYAVGMPLVAPIVQCPNCRWQEFCAPYAQPRDSEADYDGIIRRPLHQRAGDRIMVHGWTYEFGGMFTPKRWDVVVFKVPSDGITNYIKRLIGKPGETIEIIDGDIFVTDNGTQATHIARKPRHVQQTLWFPYYNHDYAPRRVSAAADYHPRWVPLIADNGWSDCDTRRPRFEGLDRDGQILFVTDPGRTAQPGQVADCYGYNRAHDRVRIDRGTRLDLLEPNIVTDVRLTCDVTVEAASEDGFIELSASKYADYFYTRLYADGRVTLEHKRGSPEAREVWGEVTIPRPDPDVPIRLALSNVDYAVSVEIDGKPIEGLQSTPEQYSVSVDHARARSQQPPTPHLRITAHNLRASLAHLLIERDVFYTNVTLETKKSTPANPKRRSPGMPGFGCRRHAITLHNDEYFVLGDNSPSSLDARFSFAGHDSDPVGPHLKAAYERGEYRLGTVPADQLIGPAFFVYWPGTAELVPDAMLRGPMKILNQLPSPGDIRWIH